MFNKHDISRDECQLKGGQAKKGYDWWWHSFTAYNKKTGEAKPFFLEFFTCNPKFGTDEPIFGQLPENQEKKIRPSYLMIKMGGSLLLAPPRKPLLCLDPVNQIFLQLFPLLLP